MSTPVNRFSYIIEQCFQALLQSTTADIPLAVQPPGSTIAAPVIITVGKTENPAACPRITVVAGSGEEALFRSGIYKVPVKVEVVTDIDTGSADTANDLFARVLDALQWFDLKTTLQATGLVFIHGLAEIRISPNDSFSDRQWVETMEIDVIGYAGSSGAVIPVRSGTITVPNGLDTATLAVTGLPAGALVTLTQQNTEEGFASVNYTATAGSLTINTPTAGTNGWRFTFQVLG